MLLYDIIALFTENALIRKKLNKYSLALGIEFQVFVLLLCDETEKM